jgi:hypothetical protein
MATQYTTLKNKTEQEICVEIENYLRGRSGIPVPSLEDFCLIQGYDIAEIENFKLGEKDLKIAIRKMQTRAIVTLEKFLLLDVSNIEFRNDDGKSYKLDKKGIIHQLEHLRKMMKE